VLLESKEDLDKALINSVNKVCYNRLIPSIRRRRPHIDVEVDL